MLSEITREFETRNPGVASFETFAAECLAEMRNDPANACLYLMLGQTAKQFYDRFADQPLTLEQANAGKARMLALAKKAEAALAKPAEAKIEVLNDIALSVFAG